MSLSAAVCPKVSKTLIAAMVAAFVAVATLMTNCGSNLGTVDEKIRLSHSENHRLRLAREYSKLWHYIQKI
jgi:hypothetical protein